MARTNILTQIIRTDQNRIYKLLIVLILSLSGRDLAAQHQPVKSVPFKHLYPALSTSEKPRAGLIYHSVSMNGRDRVFLDSLKQKAARNRITRKLYEIVVVAPDSVSNRTVSGKSESEYGIFSGRRIRNIEIKRLPVFGADIDNPDFFNPYKSQKLLNKTHVNTIEYIIRNNLLFERGDTLSPLTMSDNERLLRELPFIDDARIVAMPLPGNEVDILVITKDVYSLGGSFSPFGFKKGKISVFDNNIMGLGNEMGIEIPFDNTKENSPGFGTHIFIDNPAKTFINTRLFYYDGLGEQSYGIDMSRRFISSTSRYSGGLMLRRMNKSNAIDTLTVPNPLKYVFQDYWISRAFLIDYNSVSRLIISARYINNNVFERPDIGPDQYHSLQKYRLYLGSIAFTRQKFYKASLVYEYGRIEDIPYGSLFRVTLGREINEFKVRNYAGSEYSFSRSYARFGYIHFSSGLGAYVNGTRTEQGILTLRAKYFSNLFPLGKNMIRNFIGIDYTRGFDRNLDEHLNFYNDHGFSGFRNDSVSGAQRLTINLETVVFNPVNIYGFRFAFFGFADISALSGTNEVLSNGTILSGIGLGIRVRNDNLIFKTFQVRLGFFPDPPDYSRINYFTISGEQPVRFENFDSGLPSMIPYR